DASSQAPFRIEERPRVQDARAEVADREACDARDGEPSVQDALEEAADLLQHPLDDGRIAVEFPQLVLLPDTRLGEGEYDRLLAARRGELVGQLQPAVEIGMEAEPHIGLTERVVDPDEGRLVLEADRVVIEQQEAIYSGHAVAHRHG